MLFGYSRLLVLPLGVHAEISLRPRQLLCFCQWSGNILPFLFATVGCHVLAANSASKFSPFYVHFPECHSGILVYWLHLSACTLRFPCVPAICCVFANDLAKFSPLFFRYRWLSCSRGSAREKSALLNKKSPKKRFLFAFMQKMLYLCALKAQRRGLEGGICPLSESQLV